MEQFVSIALKVCEMMEMFDTSSQKIVMRFSKMYPPEKISRIVVQAKTYYWWQKNPKAAFMKAVGDINRLDKGTDVKPKTVSTKPIKLS